MIEKKNEIMTCPQNADKSGEKYSIHTITMRARMTEKSARSVTEKLTSYDNKVKQGYYPYESTKHNFSCIKYKFARQFGFNSVSISKIEKGGMCRWWLDIKINPRRMFHENNHPFVYIANPDEVIQAYQEIGYFLNIIGIDEITQDSFYIQRIDFCVNIDLGSREAANTYMRLMKKGAYPYNGSRKMEYSVSGHRYIPTINSFTVSSTGFEFSIYDKQKQLSEKEKYSLQEIREAEGIIRIELRATRRKVLREEKINQCENAMDLLLLIPQISEHNLTRYLQLTYGTGKFVQFGSAKRIIQESRYKAKSKKEMLAILKITSKNDLQVAKLFYGEQFGKYMAKFNKLGISPISIGKYSKYLEMANPVELIQNCSKNYPQ